MLTRRHFCARHYLKSHHSEWQYQSMDGLRETESSGVGVIDKAALVMSALEAGPATLAQLVHSTHLARPTDQGRASCMEKDLYQE